MQACKNVSVYGSSLGRQRDDADSACTRVHTIIYNESNDPGSDMPRLLNTALLYRVGVITSG